MLFEKLKYEDDFPIRVLIAHVEDYPVHYHQDMEFVYVLKGQINLKSGYCNYLLKEGDVFTLAGHEVHRLTEAEGENTVAVIQINTYYFAQYFPNLSNACFRTYSHNEHTDKHEYVRKALLTVLLKYMTQSPEYKTECIFTMIELIKYIEGNFNLFAFDQDVVINFEIDDHVTIERIDRIFRYIYENYSEKISLKELAEREYLNEFYLSHIIKDCTGMSFRDFLCFARVEGSEIPLLETDRKISQIARDVGFSTTAYYERHFIKWFKESPEEHREKYKPLTFSEDNEPRLRNPLQEQIISIIKERLYGDSNRNKTERLMTGISKNVTVDVSQPCIAHTDPKLELCIKLSDYKSLGFSLFAHINALHPEKVTILVERQDYREEINWLYDMLLTAGISVQVRANLQSENNLSFGHDSVAESIVVLNNVLKTGVKDMCVSLRDDDGGRTMLKGMPALITSEGIRKSSFYAYQALSLLEGDIISQGRNYCVIEKQHNNRFGYVIITYNYNDEIIDLCTKGKSPDYVKGVINSFTDRLEISFTMNIPSGTYEIVRYSMNEFGSLFNYIANDNHDGKTGVLRRYPDIAYAAPHMEILRENVKTSFNMEFDIGGAGIQIGIIEPID